MKLKSKCCKSYKDGKFCKRCPKAAELSQQEQLKLLKHHLSKKKFKKLEKNAA